MNSNTDEANGGGDQPKDVTDGENADYESSADENNCCGKDLDNDTSREDQPEDKSGKDQLSTDSDDNAIEYVMGPSHGASVAFEGELTKLEEEGSEEEYAVTEEGSQA